jgi:hypothetical protein
MSLKTWKAEYYTKSAAKVGSNTLKAIQHSLKKWKGLSKEELKKYDLVRKGYAIENKLVPDGEIAPYLCINAASCALCHIFMDSSGGCDKCPLNFFLGHRCDQGHAFTDNPFKAWVMKGDNTIMVKALKRILELELIKKQS